MADRSLDRYLAGPEAARQRPGVTPGGFEQGEAPCLMLDLVQRGGDRVALAYSYLTSIELAAEGRLTLNFAGRVVAIEGRGLVALHNALIVHLVWRIVESDTDFDDEKRTTWIKAITIEGAA
ncbi:MAG: hypothetical protein IT434_12900 [Phycisphaerales bacterium]|nr:hypothetical protein [Phycisphaerales bacterium]